MSAGSVMAKQQDVSVKIKPEVYRMVKTVAAWRGVNVSDYLSEIVAPIVKRDMAKMNRESASQAEEQDKE